MSLDSCGLVLLDNFPETRAIESISIVDVVSVVFVCLVIHMLPRRPFQFLYFF